MIPRMHYIAEPGALPESYVNTGLTKIAATPVCTAGQRQGGPAGIVWLSVRLYVCIQCTVCRGSNAMTYIWVCSLTQPHTVLETPMTRCYALRHTTCKVLRRKGNGVTWRQGTTGPRNNWRLPTQAPSRFEATSGGLPSCHAHLLAVCQRPVSFCCKQSQCNASCVAICTQVRTALVHVHS